MCSEKVCKKISVERNVFTSMLLLMFREIEMTKY